MTTYLNAIDRMLDQVRESANHKPIRPFYRQHIFHGILSYCSKGESQQNRLDMMFQFSQFEKCVNSIKRRDRAQTAHWVSLIDATPMQLDSEIAKAGMDSLYFPAIALKDYFEGQHARALDGLSKSIALFNRMYDDGFQEAVFGMVEQNLNKIRVLVTNRDTELANDAAIDTAVDLLDFLYGKQGGPTYRNVELSVICAPAERMSMVAHYTDEIFTKFLGTNNAELVNRFFARLFPRCEQWMAGDVKHALLLVSALDSGKADDDLLDFSDEQLALWRLPLSIQFLLTSALLQKAACDDSDCTDQRKEAITNFLRRASAYKRIAGIRWTPNAVRRQAIPEQRGFSTPIARTDDLPDAALLANAQGAHVEANLQAAC